MDEPSSEDEEKRINLDLGETLRFLGQEKDSVKNINGYF